MTTTKHEDTRTGEASTATDGAATASTNGKAWTMAMEAFNDQLSRVEQMGEDHNGAWDLSDNDTAAIRAVLEDRLRLWAALQSIAANSCCGPCREAGMFAAAALRDTPAVPAGATPPVAIRAGSAQDSSSSSSALASSPPASPLPSVTERLEWIQKAAKRALTTCDAATTNPSPGEVLAGALQAIHGWAMEAVASPPASAPPFGTWAKDDPRRRFVEGAKWWQFHKGKATAFASEVDEMEAEATRRFGEPVAPASAPQGDTPAYCPIHQHYKWCEHNGGVLRASGYEAPQGDTHDTTNDDE